MEKDLKNLFKIEYVDNINKTVIYLDKEWDEESKQRKTRCIYI